MFEGALCWPGDSSASDERTTLSCSAVVPLSTTREGSHANGLIAIPRLFTPQRTRSVVPTDVGEDALLVLPVRGSKTECDLRSRDPLGRNVVKERRRKGGE